MVISKSLIQLLCNNSCLAWNIPQFYPAETFYLLTETLCLDTLDIDLSRIFLALNCVLFFLSPLSCYREGTKCSVSVTHWVLTVGTWSGMWLLLIWKPHSTHFHRVIATITTTETQTETLWRNNIILSFWWAARILVNKNGPGFPIYPGHRSQ